MDRWQLVVPQLLRKEVFEQLHGSPTCGHFGVTKTLARIRERFFGHVVVSRWKNGVESVRNAPPVKGLAGNIRDQ